MSTQNDLDPRVVRTRALLMEALMGLLGQKTLQSITVQDITKAAQVNRSTFYAHFEDKFALFDYLIHEMFSESINSKVPPTAGFSRENLRLLFIGVCESLAMYNHKCSPAEKQFRSMIEAQIQVLLYERILGWVEPLSSAPEVAAAMISWTIFGIGLRWTEDGPAQDLETLADRVLALLTEGALTGLAAAS